MTKDKQPVKLMTWYQQLIDLRVEHENRQSFCKLLEASNVTLIEKLQNADLLLDRAQQGCKAERAAHAATKAQLSIAVELLKDAKQCINRILYDDMIIKITDFLVKQKETK